MVPSDTLAPLLARLAESVVKQRANTPLLIPPRPDKLPADVRAERAAWDEVLGIVRRAFPEALLCGGAIRNYKLGVPVKDYDVFVTWQGTLNEAAWVWLEAFPGVHSGVTYRESRLIEPQRAELAGVIHLTNLPGMPKPVELVLVKGHTKADVLNDVRAGVLPLNFGVYDGSLRLPEELEKDMEAREITVLLDRLPDDPLAALPWIRRVIALQQLTGWPVVYK